MSGPTVEMISIPPITPHYISMIPITIRFPFRCITISVSQRTSAPPYNFHLPLPLIHPRQIYTLT